MPPTPIMQNDLISCFRKLVGTGILSNYELAQIFSGKFDQPLQMAIRHRKTLRIILVDLHRDGWFAIKT